MIKHELRSCPRCDKLISVKVRKPNHVLHAVLTLLTCGLWIVVWIAAILEASLHKPSVKCSCAPRAKFNWSRLVLRPGEEFVNPWRKK